MTHGSPFQHILCPRYWEDDLLAMRWCARRWRMDVGSVERRWFSFMIAMVRAIAVCIAFTVCGGRQDANAATSGATIIDHAHLFTARDNSTINRTAAIAGLQLIVVTDNQLPGDDGNSWLRHTAATYGAADVVLLTIDADLADPSQSLVAVWSGNALGVTATDDQSEADALVAATPSTPLVDRIVAMIGRLQAASEVGLRAKSVAATTTQTGLGILLVTALMVILAWIFVFYRRKRSAPPLSLPTRLVGGAIFTLITLLWTGAAYNTIDMVNKGGLPVTGIGSARFVGAIAGDLLIDLAVMLGAVSVVRRLMRRRPRTVPPLPTQEA